MNNVLQFLHDSKNALSSHDDIRSERHVNTDRFNATIKFNDLWNDAHQEIVDKYSLPPFHLWESGFVKGDANEEELFEAIQMINSIEGSNVVYINRDEDSELQTNIYEFLDRKLLEAIRPKTEKLIGEYNAFCEKEL